MSMQMHGTSRKPYKEVVDARVNSYSLWLVDTSSSMNDDISYSDEHGEMMQVRKIDELNCGIKLALTNICRFEETNVFYRFLYQIIELNSYGKALFPEFVPVSMQTEPIRFEANGVTCLENTIATLKSFLDPKYIPGCKHAVNVILVSDGRPTDTDGYELSHEEYMKIIHDFKKYLEKSGMRPNVDLYAIGIGSDACKEMLVAFADEGNYYEVGAMESLAEKFNYVTRKTLVRMTVSPIEGADTELDAEDTEDDEEELDMEEEDAIEEEESDDIFEIDVSKCLGNTCLSCMDSCEYDAIRYENGLVVIQPDMCIGCKACAEDCPVDAIRVAESDAWDDLL